MIIGEAIARARKDIGVSSDDATVGARYIYSIIKTVRNELLRQEIEKKGIWPGYPMQTLKAFELERIDMAELNGFESGNVGYKSCIAFPELLDSKVGKIFGGVFLPTMQRIDVISFTQWINNKKRRYSFNNVTGFFRDNNLYITDYPVETESLVVDVDGVYESPEEVERLNKKECDEENNCVYYPDLEFHLPDYLAGRFFRIVRQELALTLGIPLDNTNDGKADQPLAQTQKRNVENPG